MSRALVAIVTVLASAVVSVTACSGGTTDTYDALGRFRPVDPELAGGDVYLLPASTDAVRAADIVEISTDQGDGGSVVILGVPTDDGIDDLVWVLIAESDAAREPGGTEDFEEVEIDGTPARLNESHLGASVEWLRDGRTLIVMGPTDRPGLALEVARAVDPDAEGASIVSTLPAEHRLLDAATVEGADWVAPSFTVFLDSVLLNGTPPIPGFPTLYMLTAGAQSLTWVDVRGGRGAWWSTAQPVLEGGPPDAAFRVLAWLERPDLVVQLSGSRPVDELLAIAESLEVVDRSDFDAFDVLLPPGGISES